MESFDDATPLSHITWMREHFTVVNQWGEEITFEGSVSACMWRRVSCMDSQLSLFRGWNGLHYSSQLGDLHSKISLSERGALALMDMTCDHWQCWFLSSGGFSYIQLALGDNVICLMQSGALLSFMLCPLWLHYYNHRSCGYLSQRPSARSHKSLCLWEDGFSVTPFSTRAFMCYTTLWRYENTQVHAMLEPRRKLHTLHDQQYVDICLLNISFQNNGH